MLTRNQKRRLGISTTQLNNLIILHNGLIDLLPKKAKRGFNMAQYCADTCKSVTRTTLATKENPCNTVACAAGHGPSCGIPFEDNELMFNMDDGNPMKIVGARWSNYIQRAFGINRCEDSFRFLFSGSWATFQNREVQMEQAIARLKVFITSGLPKDFRMQGVYDTSQLTVKLPKASYKD